jgi:hypothetical protein
MLIIIVSAGESGLSPDLYYDEQRARDASPQLQIAASPVAEPHRGKFFLQVCLMNSKQENQQTLPKNILCKIFAISFS